MAISMTGYGRGYVEENGRGFQVELKSVNNRYLDINVKLPRHLSPLEDRIRKYISTKVARGKIDVYITQDKFSKDDILIKVDKELAESYYTALSVLKEQFGINDDISLNLLSRYQDIISIEKHEEDIEVIWGILVKALDLGLDDFIKMRKVEGTRLCEDIEKRSNMIRTMVTTIEENADLVISDYREKLRQRISDFLNDVAIDEARLLNEVAFYADRSNITEEIVRLKSHLIQLEKTVRTDETIGKKLDFLIQEMNREVNTIGSKTGSLEITGLVVDIKSEIEKIREQIQNIE